MDPSYWLSGLVVRTQWLGLFGTVVGFKNKVYIYNEVISSLYTA